MRKIRVLIVDDAVVVRKIVSDTLAADPEIEVAGVAANGKIALQKIAQVNPDLITLDVEMPEMDGLETLDHIRKQYPLLPVIMFSTLTERGTVTTLDALYKGATDYITKPANVGSVNAALQRIRDDLIPKIKALCAQKVGLQPPETLPAPKPFVPKTSPPTLHKQSSPVRVDAVVMGVSTGGPNALAELIPTFPKNFQVPILIVQHMPPFFTRLLAERLGSNSNLEVVEAKSGDEVSGGRVYIAQGDYHMTLVRNGNRILIQTNQSPPENSCRPSVDVLLKSAVQVYGKHCLAAILTGMGKDGLIGCQHLHEVGGKILAQDEETSVVWGMPAFVVKARIVEKVLPLRRIGTEIIARCRVGRDLPTIN